MNDNLRIWNVLGKTDPAHTKAFKRPGGFSGTAVKPMWANKQMTEMFGPCGLGWGQTEPQFQVIPAADEILVYCTVGIWYIDGDIKCGPVYGVGGDKVLVKLASGIRTDDEAFKKSYTDAIGNATKFIGMAADVHMGLFDDNKYVASLKDEFADAGHAEVDRQKAAPASVPAELDWHYNAASGILICRIVDAKLSKKKSGDGELVTVKFNRDIEGKNMAFYFHTTHRQELLAGIGKIAKLIVQKKGEFVNIMAVMEIDGLKVDAADDNPESDARKLAKELEFTEGDLSELKDRFCNGDWTEVLIKLHAEKERRATA